MLKTFCKIVLTIFICSFNVEAQLSSSSGFQYGIGDTESDRIFDFFYWWWFFTTQSIWSFILFWFVLLTVVGMGYIIININNWRRLEEFKKLNMECNNYALAIVPQSSHLSRLNISNTQPNELRFNSYLRFGHFIGKFRSLFTQGTSTIMGNGDFSIYENSKFEGKGKEVDTLNKQTFIAPFVLRGHFFVSTSLNKFLLRVTKIYTDIDTPPVHIILIFPIPDIPLYFLDNPTRSLQGIWRIGTDSSGNTQWTLHS